MVSAIDYSHDATQIVTASIAGDIRIWDAKSGKRLQAWSIVGMPDTTTFCGPKSERVVLGETQTASLLTFDAKTGRPGPKVPGLIRPAASADGTVLAAVTKQGAIVFLDPATLAKSAPIQVGKELMQLRFSPDGKQLLVEELMAGKAYLIDRAAAKVVAVQHGAMRGGFQFLPDGKSLLGVSQRKARRLSLPGGENAEEWAVPAGTTDVVPRGEGAEVLLTGANGGIAQFTLASGEVKHEFDEHRGNINRMVVSPDGKVLVSGGWDGAVRFWDLDAGKQLFVGPEHDNAVTAVSIAADGKAFVSGCWDNSTIRWGADGKAVAKVHEHKYLVTAVQIAADGSWWSASQDGTVRHWANDGKPLATIELEKEGPPPLAMVLAGGQAMLGVADGTVRWLDLAAGKESKRWAGHGSSVLAVVADEAGTFVASLEEGGTVIVWNVATGEPQHHWVVHEKGASALVHMGGGVLVATGEGNTLARYDGKAGKELQRVKFEHPKAIPSLGALAALPSRGAVLAAGDGVVFALAAADLQVLGTVDVPSAATSFATSADGSVVVAGLDDGTLAQWKLAAPKPKK